MFQLVKNFCWSFEEKTFVKQSQMYSVRKMLKYYAVP